MSSHIYTTETGIGERELARAVSGWRFTNSETGSCSKPGWLHSDQLQVRHSMASSSSGGYKLRLALGMCCYCGWFSAILSQIFTYILAEAASQFDCPFLKQGLCSPRWQQQQLNAALMSFSFLDHCRSDTQKRSNRSSWATATPQKGPASTPPLTEEDSPVVSQISPLPSQCLQPMGWVGDIGCSHGSSVCLKSKKCSSSYFETMCLGPVSNWMRQEKPEALLWAHQRQKYNRVTCNTDLSCK